MTAAGRPTPSPDDVTTIDVHAHFVPEAFLDRARDGAALDGVRVERIEGVDWLVHRQGFRYPVGRDMYTVDGRLASMDAMGIDVTVLSLSPSLFFYWAPASDAARFARRANEGLAELVESSGMRIEGLATLPMQDPRAAVAELRYAVDALDLRGAQIGTNVEERSLDGEEFEQVFAAAEGLGVPLVLHPYYSGPRDGLEDYYLVNLIGIPLDTTTAAARLIFGGILDRHPELRIMLLHGGGFLPYQIGRLDHGRRVREEARTCEEVPSRYLRRFTFDTITHAPEVLRFLIDSVGADRVAYGTDSPFDMGAGSLADQVNGAELDAEELAGVAHRNGARLFGIGETATRGHGTGDR